MIHVYLLAVSELRRRMEEIAALPGWDRLAPWQQEKISRCTRTGTRALCMGGQLLLQYGAHKKSVSENPQSGRGAEQETDGTILWQHLSYSRLLEEIPAPFPLQAAYGHQGKPYIVGVPWHYNLSHSGDYVALAVGDAPVGVDIQQMRPCRDSLVKRFFSEEEAAVYESLTVSEIPERSTSDGRRHETAKTLFYTLWCRKEAYGKLKGTGLTEDVLKRNMLEDVDAHLYEYGGIPGYRVCVCSGEI